MANKNQKQIRKFVAKTESGTTLVFDVPRSDYDKGCSSGRTSPSAFVKREIVNGYEARRSKKPKVVWNADKKSRFSDN